jgi:hypothetical protein
VVLAAATAADLARLDASTRPDLRENTLLDWVPISKMFVAAYGRPLNRRKVTEMRLHFNPNALGTVLLSYRADDTYALLDGHHRKATAEEEGMTEMAARIYIDLTYEQEAELYGAFATVNQQSALDRFRAKLEAKDTKALSIQRILQSHGLDISVSGPAIGKIQAASALEAIQKQHGDDFLDEMIGVLYDGWGTASRAWTSQSLYGMSGFWNRYRSYANRARLIDIMHQISPERILQGAGNYLHLSLAQSNQRTGWGMALAEAYNRGMRRNKLPAWDLRVLGAPGRETLAKKAAEQNKERATSRKKSKQLDPTEDVVEA